MSTEVKSQRRRELERYNADVDKLRLEIANLVEERLIQNRKLGTKYRHMGSVLYSDIYNAIFAHQTAAADMLEELEELERKERDA